MLFEIGVENEHPVLFFEKRYLYPPFSFNPAVRRERAADAAAVSVVLMP